MKRLPNVEISDQQLDLIIDDGLFDYGGEAIVCRNNNPNTLYKIFVKPLSNVPDTMVDNKFKKITWIYQHPLEHTVMPTATITNNGNLIGYEMTYDREDEALLNAILTPDETIACLQETAKILKYYASKDITFGDVKNDNILINNNNQIKFCDIDNMRIGDMQVDIMSYALTDYFQVNKAIDAKADAYMHNLLVLEQLKYNNLPYKSILSKLKSRPNMSEFSKEMKKIFSSLAKPEQFNGDYAIQYIKK